MSLNLSKVVSDTKNMGKSQMVRYLKKYKGRELTALANELGFCCSVNTPKTVALEKSVKIFNRKQ